MSLLLTLLVLLVRRAVDSVNRERAAGTDLSPVAYIQTYVREGKAAVARATADGNDAGASASCGARRTTISRL